MRIPRRPIVSALIYLLVFPAASGPSQTLPDLGDAAQAVISPAQERKLGEATMRQVHASGAYLDDPEVEAYLNTLGQRLVTALPGAHPEFEFSP
jgi:predicted Zn-dependent protease